jgi:hypothetical protein
MPDEITDVTPPEVHEERQAENARDGVVEAHVTELPPRDEILDDGVVEDDGQGERVAADDDGQGERVAESPADDYNLASVLEDDESLPYEYRTDPEVAGTLTEVGEMAKEAGVTPEMARMLVGAYAGIALTEQDRIPDIHDDEAVLNYMGHVYGQKEADAIVRGAQEATRHFGPKFSAWLDRTRLGSHPSMLLLLSAMAPKDGLYARNSPAQARAAMKQLRADPKQKWDTPGAKARWRLLTALANMEDKPRAKSDIDRLKADVKAAKVKPTSATKDLDQQLADLRLHPGYSNKRHESHKQVWERYWGLMTRRWPGVHDSGSD